MHTHSVSAINQLTTQRIHLIDTSITIDNQRPYADRLYTYIIYIASLSIASRKSQRRDCSSSSPSITPLGLHLDSRFSERTLLLCVSQEVTTIKRHFPRLHNSTTHALRPYKAAVVLDLPMGIYNTLQPSALSNPLSRHPQGDTSYGSSYTGCTFVSRRATILHIRMCHPLGDTSLKFRSLNRTVRHALIELQRLLVYTTSWPSLRLESSRSTPSRGTEYG